MTDRPAEPTLFDKVDGLTDELRGVRSAVDRDAASRDKQTAMFERKLNKARLSIRLSVAAIVAVALLVGFKWQDDRRKAVADCKAANRTREQSEVRTEEAGSTLIDSFARVISAANPPKDPDAFAALFDKVKTDYVQRMRDNYNQSADLRPRSC